MYQPYSSTGQPAGPLQPPRPSRCSPLIESRGIVRMFTVALTWLIGFAAMWLLWRPEGYGHE